MEKEAVHSSGRKARELGAMPTTAVRRDALGYLVQGVGAVVPCLRAPSSAVCSQAQPARPQRQQTTPIFSEGCLEERARETEMKWFLSRTLDSVSGPMTTESI